MWRGAYLNFGTMSKNEPGRRHRILLLPAGVDAAKNISVEEMMKERLGNMLQQSEAPVVEVSLQEEIPEVYTQGEDWPVICNMQCASCTLLFKGSPFFVPASMVPSEVEGKIVYSFRRRKEAGVTCSANCAMTYVNTCLRGNEADEAKELIIHLYYARFEKRVVWIEPSPRHTQMAIYGGGKMTRDEMKERIDQLVKKTAQRTPTRTAPIKINDDQEKAAPRLAPGGGGDGSSVGRLKQTPVKAWSVSESMAPLQEDDFEKKLADLLSMSS